MGRKLRNTSANALKCLPICMLLACGSDAPHEHDDHRHGQKTAAEMARMFNDPARDEWQRPEAVIACFGDLDDKLIMDLGAGAGYFSFKLAAHGAKVIAADVEQDYLEFIHRTGDSLGFGAQIETRSVPYDSPGLHRNEVDGVLIVDTYHHIQDRVAYLELIKIGLKPQGKIVIVEYFPDQHLDKGPPAEMRLEPEQVSDELEQAGFSSVMIHAERLQRQYVLEAFLPE